MTMSSRSEKLIAPYGGKLVDLLVQGEERLEWIGKANHLPSAQLSERALCDLELLATGGFSPLTRFMGKADYESVLPPCGSPTARCFRSRLRSPWTNRFSQKRGRN